MLFKVETIDAKNAWIESEEVQVVFELDDQYGRDNKWPVKTRLRMRDGHLIDVRDKAERVVEAIKLANKENRL